MTGVGGTGYALIALGPAVALFIVVIAPKPFLILTVLTSALLWLVSLIVISSIWRAFLPIGSTLWLFLTLIVSAVGIQESVRLLFWKLYVRVEGALNTLAVKLSKPWLLVSDKIEIALACGLGHGVAHGVFFCLSLLTPAFGPATFYVDNCVHMPFFLVAALTSLGFLLLHTFSMIIAFNAHTVSNCSHQLFVPAMHLGAALLTLVNLLPGGCIAGVPMILICAMVTMAVCGKIVWDMTGPEFINSGSLHRIHSATGL